MKTITFKNGTQLKVNTKVMTELSEFIRDQLNIRPDFKRDLFIYSGTEFIQGEFFGTDGKMIRISEILSVE